MRRRHLAFNLRNLYRLPGHQRQAQPKDLGARHLPQPVLQVDHSGSVSAHGGLDSGVLANLGRLSLWFNVEPQSFVGTKPDQI